MRINTLRNFNIRHDYRGKLLPRMDDQVFNWYRKIISHGGILSSNTLIAVNSFYEELITLDVFPKIHALNVIAPDCLEACLTPLIANKGYDIWKAPLLKPSDLTKNGIKGENDGPTVKYIDTGLDLSSSTVEKYNFGVTIYISEGNANEEADFGACTVEDDITDYTCCMYADGVATSWACWGYITNPSVPISPWEGYFCGSRWPIVGPNFDNRLYYWNPTYGHGMQQSFDSIPNDNQCQNVNLFFLGINNANVDILYPSTKRYSFMAMHEKLTEPESEDFSTAIHNYRVNLGGGYVV